MLLTVALYCLSLLASVDGKLDVGAACGNAKDHCDAPKSGLGCCVGNTKCYSTADCASFLETCPFSDDTKKGKSLAGCLPDKSDFNKAACSADAKGKVTSADGKEVPLAANVTCFQSEKLTCDIYRNATGHSFITASCKASAKRSSSAQVPASLWQCCLLLGKLVASLLVVLGMPL